MLYFMNFTLPSAEFFFRVLHFVLTVMVYVYDFNLLRPKRKKKEF